MVKLCLLADGRDFIRISSFTVHLTGELVHLTGELSLFSNSASTLSTTRGQEDSGLIHLAGMQFGTQSMQLFECVRLFQL